MTTIFMFFASSQAWSGTRPHRPIAAKAVLLASSGASIGSLSDRLAELSIKVGQSRRRRARFEPPDLR
jgi:hypothetical protein